jgi:hypothetical protein
MFKTILPVLLLTLSQSIYAEEKIEIKGPNDICMKGICIFDDIEKHPQIMNIFKKTLQQINNPKFCQRVSGPTYRDFKIGKDKFEVTVFEYVKPDNKIGFKVGSIIYKTGEYTSLSAQNNKAILDSYMEKYTENSFSKNIPQSGNYEWSKTNGYQGPSVKFSSSSMNVRVDFSRGPATKEIMIESEEIERAKYNIKTCHDKPTL